MEEKGQATFLERSAMTPGERHANASHRTAVERRAVAAVKAAHRGQYGSEMRVAGLLQSTR